MNYLKLFKQILKQKTCFTCKSNISRMPDSANWKHCNFEFRFEIVDDNFKIYHLIHHLTYSMDSFSHIDCCIDSYNKEIIIEHIELNNHTVTIKPSKLSIDDVMTLSSSDLKSKHDVLELFS